MANDYSPNRMSEAIVKNLAFKTYVGRINELAESANMTSPGTPYADAESWRDAFNDGLPPEYAWSEELAACAEACA